VNPNKATEAFLHLCFVWKIWKPDSLREMYEIGVGNEIGVADWIVNRERPEFGLR
jgi:hypothetical protein